MLYSTEIVNKRNTVKTHVSAVNSADLFERMGKNKNGLFVADKTFYETHKNLTEYLPAEKTFVFTGGEENKTLSSVEKILGFFKDKNADRSTIVYAIGGGVTGDVTGFACSVYMRGIEYVNVPTTLLSMCDSSVGGKTGVDYDGVKNLVGTFYPPSRTVIAVDLVKDLTKPPFNDGVSEILKCAMVGDSKIYKMLQNKSFDLAELIIRTLKVKAKYVKKDFYDRGERKILNLGHTFAHAIESASDLTVSHGKAVGAGLVLATKYACRQKICREDFSDEITKILASYGLDATCPYSVKELVPYMKKDKKADENGVFMILPVAKNKCEIRYVTFESLEKAEL